MDLFRPEPGEREAVGVRAADERREVDEVDTGHVRHPRGAESVDRVAGARGEAENAGGGGEEAEAAERGEGGRCQGSGAVAPARREAQFSEAAVGRDHAAGGCIAGIAGKWGEREGQREGARRGEAGGGFVAQEVQERERGEGGHRDRDARDQPLRAPVHRRR